MSDEELAKAYLSHAFDKAVEKVGAATVAKSLVSDAQKPVDWQKPVFTYLIDNIRRTTHFDADLISEILEYAKRHKVAQPKLTPPDGWAEAVGLAKIMAQLSKPLSERRAEILAQAILDMDAKIKEQK